jgi:hypothetical protein
MRNELLTELKKSKLDLDRFFSVAINRQNVRLMAEFDTTIEQDLKTIGFVYYNDLYDETRTDMLEYKKGNIQIVLTK